MKELEKVSQRALIGDQDPTIINQDVMCGSDERATLLWWRALKLLASLNMIMWIFASWHLTERTSGDVPELTWWHLGLSGIYALVCAFRSYLPRIDLERYVLSDRFASSVVLGRSAATIAEISFAIQMKLFVDELSVHAGLTWVSAWSLLIVSLLGVAQLFCWWSVLTLNHLGHMIEESIWGCTFAFIGVIICLCLPTLEGIWWTIGISSVCCVGVYVLFMLIIDVPMYHQRWRRDQRDGSVTLQLSEGWRDALYRRELTRSWAIWRHEAAWLTGYFACAVWLSISLAFLPR